MRDARNPWVHPSPPLPAIDQDHIGERGRQATSRRRSRLSDAEAEVETPLTGPPTPQDGIPLPVSRLPVRRTTKQASLWVVGAHGGAGESSIATLDPGWAATGHSWPAADVWCPTIVVARTNVRGLTAAQAALTQWAARGTGTSVDLLGLVLVADAPGRLPKPLADLAVVVQGGAPRTWNLPWLESWRHGEPDDSDRGLRRMVQSLHQLIDQPPTAQAIANSQAAAAATATQGKEAAS